MTTSRVFLATFAPTAAGVAALVLYGRPEAALIAGIAGLVLHWLLTAKPQHDGEMADASYFFGFLLTLDLSRRGTRVPRLVDRGRGQPSSSAS